MLRRSASLISRLTILVLSVAGLLLVNGASSQAAVIEVNTTADQVGNAPGCSLRQAVSAADLDFAQGGCAAGLGADTIKVPGGTYKLTIPGDGETINQTGDLNVNGGGALTIMASSDSAVVIDAAGIDRVLRHAGAGQLSLVDITIRGGRLNPMTNGSGILNSSGLLALEGVTVTDNSAQAGAGGGISNQSVISVINSTISGNSAKGNGGGYFGSMASVATFRSVTVFGNSADAFGTNSGNGGGVATSGTLNTFNTVIAGNNDNSPMEANQVPDCSTGPNFFPRYTLIGVPSPANCLKGFDPGTNLTGDPKLGALGDHGGPTATHVPLEGSPLADVGGAIAPDLCPPVDQRGVARPQGGGCDIGAVELDPNGLDKPVVPTTGKASLKLKRVGKNVTRAVKGGKVTLRIKVRNVGDTASGSTRVCLAIKGKARSAVKPAGKRCVKLGQIQPGKSKAVGIKLKVRKSAPSGRTRVRLVGTAGNADARRIGMSLRIG